MARKELDFTVIEDGRDKGKTYHLTEMAASKAERWAIRAFLAMAKGGIDLPPGIESAGMAGIAKIGLSLLAQMPFEIAEPLLDEMMECVTFVPNPSTKRALVEDDIEEVATRIKLRKAVFGLHVDFFQQDGQSISAPASAQQNTVSVNIKTRR